MFTFLSLVTSIKDYIEVVHKLVETNPSNSFEFNYYSDFGAILTYFVLTGKEIFVSLVTFKWLQNLTALPLIVPDIASAMLSEISVFDGYFHNAFTFLETPVSYGNQNVLFYSIEKFVIGFVNSLFLCLPTSTAHIITLRRFVMQGLEAGYFAGLGTLVGNFVWIGSIVFGLRFIVIPWLSFDILRYGLGFLLLMKYMWDSYSERRTVLEDLSKRKIFLLNFLLAFTEQATIYPFVSNLSIGSDTTLLETFPTNSFFEYSIVHVCYLAGLVVGGLSLLQFTCWFWENPAFNIYMWAMSSLKMTNTVSQRFVNLFFLYLTMFFAISNVSYFGLDYTLTHPLGFVYEDRLLEQKNLIETSFLNTKASDRNTRRNRGRHGRRERWKRRVRRYRTFDASLYDQGVYDLFTIEDLNYGFDRFWLRRKIRNHRVRFRFFPGPWMRSFKKQLARPRLESFMGPRVEFFRILFEQAYHPEFHEFRTSSTASKKTSDTTASSLLALKSLNPSRFVSFYSETNEKRSVKNLVKEHSALRKFVRKAKTRTNIAEILFDVDNKNVNQNIAGNVRDELSKKSVYSKRWKRIFSKISHDVNAQTTAGGLVKNQFARFYNQNASNGSNPTYLKNYLKHWSKDFEVQTQTGTSSKQIAEKQLSKKDRQLLKYKTFLSGNSGQNIPFATTQRPKSSTFDLYKPFVLLHPLQFYLQKEKAFQKKMKFYGASLFRNFGIENNAPYYRIMMKKFFYYYKPTLRWERTMRTATMRKARRKGPRIPRKLNVAKTTQVFAETSRSPFFGVDDTSNLLNSTIQDFRNQDPFLASAKTKIQKPTHFYSLVSKRATRYRYQIYKDVLQHWYYSPFNRFLLKADVDSFIRRQPTSHFLTKKEENLLHLKRFLLSDYYNTLRWYNYMEHYETMRNTIGKTKSFATRAYNQQFFGTFKKIRHLFAITPSLSENTILKFDQPLFNEYRNEEKNLNKNSAFYDPANVHEELLADDEIYANQEIRKTLPEDLTSQSTTILKTYLQAAEPIRKAYISKLIRENNYTELTNFLFKGQKVRGEIPITNQTDFLKQENAYLIEPQGKSFEKDEIAKFFQTNLAVSPSDRLNPSTSFDGTNANCTLWIALMRKCRNMLYNQEALKFYVSTRVDKLEKQKRREEKSFRTRLENMKNWSSLTNDDLNVKNSAIAQTIGKRPVGLTTALQKSIKEGLYYQLSGFFSGTKPEKSNLRNNRPELLENLAFGSGRPSKSVSLNLKNHLNQRLKSKALQTFETEKRFRAKFVAVKNLSDQNKASSVFAQANPTFITKLVQQTILPFRFVSRAVGEKVQTVNEWKATKVLSKPIQKFFGWFQQNKTKELKAWKQKETVFSTRKKIRRKIYRVLDQKKQTNKRSNVNDLERLQQIAPREKIDGLALTETRRQKKTWRNYENKNKTFSNESLSSLEVGLKRTSKPKTKNLWTEFFEKNFKRKRTRSRRYRRFKGRGPIKKHTLAEKLKRQFKLLKRYGQNDQGFDKKMEIFQMITKRKYDPNSPFEPRALKQRRTRQTKHRFWKKHKRQKYLQLKRKQRKRRRYTISKLRVLNKEFKRLKNQIELKNWWREKFLSNFISTNEAFWQDEKNKQIQQQLEKLSVSEILQRDTKNTEHIIGMLQIGNQDFKPLAVPESLRFRKQLAEQGRLSFDRNMKNDEVLNSSNSTLKNIGQSTSEMSIDGKSTTTLNANQSNATNVFANLTTNVFERQNRNFENLTPTSDSKNLVGLNPVPFYAGWDKTLRRFVVTNRLLSREDAGYTIDFTSKTDPNGRIGHPTAFSNLFTTPDSDTNDGKFTFTKAPLQGMNAATTLYWQVPFTTYDPDQFFALGMDGFSPLAWRFFNFKHSKQTTTPILVHTLFSANQRAIQQKSSFAYNFQIKMLQLNSTVKPNSQTRAASSDSNHVSKNQARKIQKRQKRVKKHPRPPVWFPSGPLANQVLPVHYIYVFYKRTRLPRDRYIGRRFRRSDDLKASFFKTNFTQILDFTLRKRVKPIRKYHRKRILNKNQDNSLILRRRPFKGLREEANRFRPFFKTRVGSQSEMLNSVLLKTKQRKKAISTKQPSENLRIRQLRRRIQRQVLRPVGRYKPRAGGFVWPGDYLRLESVKAPKLRSAVFGDSQPKDSNTSAVSVRKKKRRNIQEWQIQPKKYLLEKHNLNVLKKRLQKSQNFDHTLQKLKRLKLTD